MILLWLVVQFLVVQAINYDEAKFQEFYQMVEKNLENSLNYVSPTNNSKIAYVEDNKRYDYGNFDFIIIGAGAAGSVIANRLSEIKKWKILLLEAGGEPNEFSTIPGLLPALANSDMNWGYMSTPQKSACQKMFNSICVSPRGKVLGGSTVLNSKMMVRGNEEDYNNWSRLGNDGWSYEEILPYFKKSEKSHIWDQDIKYRGLNGEIDVSYFEDIFVTKMYLAGMQELGYNTVDYNGKQQIGAGRTQSTLLKNRTVNGNSAFLQPIKHRRNLNITTNALVNKLLINNQTKTVYGVEFIKNGRIYTAKADKEVILSAGSINSPQILMLSGIGPTEELNEINIETILDLPVGKNLQDHLMLSALVIRTDRSLFNTSVQQNLRKYFKNHRPYTAGAYLDGTGFINVDNSSSTKPNIQFVNLVMPGANFSNPSSNMIDEAREGFVKNFNQFTDFRIGVALIDPKSIGSVTLKSNSIVDFPNIDYNYLSDPNGVDIETIYKGVLQALKLLETQAYKRHNASVINVAEYCGKLDTSRKYWYCVIRSIATTIFHPVGTTAMGISPKNSVVNPKLLVHGMKNLRVADAGIMPKITSGNTQAPTYMIGEKVSDIIKFEYV